MTKTKKKPVNYVNNEDLLKALIHYKQNLADCAAKGLDKPPIPEYIGQCVLLIATNLANHKSFNGYSPDWKEEMIGDSLENVFQYLHNFDQEKTKNPFAYFTQIMWWAFVRRIQKEKKQRYIKAKNLQRLTMIDTINGIQINDSSVNLESINDTIEQFETINSKKNKSKK